jgi:hypothetical protein
MDAKGMDSPPSFETPREERGSSERVNLSAKSICHDRCAVILSH